MNSLAGLDNWIHADAYGSGPSNAEQLEAAIESEVSTYGVLGFIQDCSEDFELASALDALVSLGEVLEAEKSEALEVASLDGEADGWNRLYGKLAWRLSPLTRS